MAQAITCDVHNNEHIADVLVSQLTGSGDTFAACADGYVEMCRAVVAGAGPSEADESDADALARLAALGGDNPTASPESSDAGEAPAEPPTNAVDEPQPTELPEGAAPSTDDPDGAVTAAVGDPDGATD